MPNLGAWCLPRLRWWRSIVAWYFALWAVLPVLDAATPLSSSALLLDAARYAEAETLVERASECGSGSVQIVATLHARFTKDLQVIEYGFLRDRAQSWTDPQNFAALTPRRQRWLAARLSAAVATAEQNGLQVSLLPHIDTAGSIQEWRNQLDIDPEQIHRGYSYDSALIGPLLTAASRSTKPVLLSLAGEMGRSVFRYPDAYLRMQQRCRQRAIPQLRVGLSLNFSQVGGNEALTTSSRRSLQKLLERCDFLGLSNYRPFSLPPTPQMFAHSVRAFQQELASQGLRVPIGMPLHLSEVGLGGGNNRQGKFSPAVAAETPWEGRGLGKDNPWQSAAMRNLRRTYHDALLSFLQTADTNKQDGPLTAAYLWSEGSWDPLGIDRQEFRDPSIVQRMLKHNRQALQTTVVAPGD